MNSQQLKMILQGRYGRAQNSQDIFLGYSREIGREVKFCKDYSSNAGLTANTQSAKAE